MNTFMNELKNVNNFDRTENGDLTHKTTNSAVLDMFGVGGAYRNRSETDVITLFKDAFNENHDLAMKCLFYLRDVRGGQGERRFFRIVYRWLCNNHPETAILNLKYIPEYGRWDDLIYSVINTNPQVEKIAFNIIGKQLILDLKCKTPSLLGKWMPSQNASSEKTKRTGHYIANKLGLNSKDYRVMLSALRKKINIVERLMSENRWDEIEFDKIPSRAGLIYKNAFARKEIIAEKYHRFMSDTTKKVNASVLYPQDIAHRAFKVENYCFPLNSPERLALQKYWDNLPNYYKEKEENGLAIVDVSGSMTGIPMEAAVSLGAYIAEKAHGPFTNHFITFSEHPELVKFEGMDIVDKFNNCVTANWGCNTNIKAVFNMLLNVALTKGVKSEDMPDKLYVFSDMEFDSCVTFGKKYPTIWGQEYINITLNQANTGFERIKAEWAKYGYKLPNVVFWNLRSAKKHIPAIGKGFSYVSGFSPVMIECILSGKTGYDLMIEKLVDSGRYNVITAY